MALKMFEHCSHDDHDDDSIYKQVSSEKTHMILEWGTLVVDTHLVAWPKMATWDWTGPSTFQTQMPGMQKLILHDGLFGALSPHHPFHVYNYLFGKNECSISQPVCHFLCHVRYFSFCVSYVSFLLNNDLSSTLFMCRFWFHILFCPPSLHLDLFGHINIGSKSHSITFFPVFGHTPRMVTSFQSKIGDTNPTSLEKPGNIRWLQ